MNLILHIGLAKTGTTFLQMWLYHNRSSLAELDRIAFDPLVSHRIAVECLDDPETVHRADVVDIRRRLSLNDAFANLIAEVPNKATAETILSSEYFSVVNPEHCASLLRAKGFNVSKVILYIRRQDLYAAAGYAQDVAALKQHRPFLQIDRPAYGVKLNWAKLYATWHDNLPEAQIMVRNYEKYKSGTSLLYDFCKLLNCPQSTEWIIPERVNESLDSEMTEFARLMNSQLLPVDRMRLLQMQREIKGPSFGFSEQLTRAFENQYRSSNLDLAAHFPDELESLTETNWRPTGVDQTGLLAKSRYDELYRTMSSF